jgi:prepilin-type processing-associated H-X9-DG protein
MNLRRKSQKGEFPTKKRIKRPDKPRWWNQTYVIFLVLRRENRLMSRAELIPKVLELDKEIAAKKGLPTLFHGKTPQNTVSGRLTENNEKYFVRIVPEGTKRQFFKVSFQPGDFDSAYENYKDWTRKLIELDWPYFFGDRTAESKPVTFEKPLEASIVVDKPEEDVDSLSRTLEGFMDQESEIHSDIVDGSLGTVEATGSQIIDTDKDESKPSEAIETTNDMLEPQSEPLDPVPTDKPTKEYHIPKSLDEVLQVKESLIPNAGKGVFAKMDIPKHTYLGFYFGVPVDEDEFDSLKDGVGVASEYAHRYNHTVLDATNEQGILYDQVVDGLECPFYYINESKKVNIAFVDGNVVNQIICMSTKAIKAGEELYVHYGPEIPRPWLQENDPKVDAAIDSTTANDSDTAVDLQANPLAEKTLENTPDNTQENTEKSITP